MHFGTLQTSLVLLPGPSVPSGTNLTLQITGAQPNASVQVQSTATVDQNGNPLTGQTPVPYTLGNTDATGAAMFGAVTVNIGSWSNDVYIGGSYAGTYQFTVTAPGAAAAAGTILGMSPLMLGLLAVGAAVLLKGKRAVPVSE